MDLGTRISNSWELTKACFKVLVGNPQLLVFPIASMVATTIIILGFLGFSISTLIAGSMIDIGAEAVMAINIVGWIVIYYLIVFVAIFCNVAIVGSAGMMLDGKRPTVSDGFRVAMSRIGPIIGWTLVTGTVSLIIKAIQNRSGNIGKIVMGMIGIAWTILTYFVVPVIVFEGIGPFQALKRSTQILKKIWGESLVTNFGIHMVIGIAILVLAVLMVPLVLISININPILLIGVIGLFIVLVAAISLVGTALKAILMAVLYRYATTGRAGFGISTGSLGGMFSSKDGSGPVFGRRNRTYGRF
jgi:hypothetical protein